MKNILFTILFLSTATIFAQNFEIYGTLQDENKTPIESATVYVESIQDSTMITYTISDKDGKFNLSGNTKQQKANFYVSFTGMKTYKKLITLVKNSNLNTIILQENNELLNEILVVADRAPITIKKDTLQFNASSFKTGADANVEDLLKKLPGLVVDKSGKITVNGKPVNKILVNGKEFFGNDLTIATKNLPKEIIDKIQVVDTKTKEQAFTGEEGDKENKTINITIKKDKNKGFFGRLTAGYGTDDRYSASGMLNRFNNNERITILGGSNNVNTSGFNSDEVKDIGGGGNNWVRRNGVWQSSSPLFGNFNGGITQTSTAGVHYTNEWNKKTDINTDYIFTESDTETGSINTTQTFLPTVNYTTKKNNSATRIAKNHNFNLEFEIKPDTLTRISIKPKVSKSLGDNFSNNNSSREDNLNSLINESATSTNGNYENTNYGLNASVSRKFKQKGESLSFWMDTDFDKNDTKDVFKSSINYFDGGTTPNESTNQQNTVTNKTNDISLSLRYTRVLKGNFFYTLRMSGNFENSKNNKKTLDFDNSTQKYTNLNSALTTNFKTKTTKYSPSAGLKYSKDKMNIRASVGYDLINIDDQNLLANTSTTNDFNNLRYSLSVWNRFGQGKSFWLSYRKSHNAPRISQLQAITDVSNPLNIVIGNPNLKAATTDRMHLSFRNNNMKTKSGFSIYGSVSFTDNQAVSKSITDLVTLKRTTTYTNVDGQKWYYTNANYHKKYKFDKHNFSWNTGVNISGNRNVGFSNGAQYTSNSFSYGPNISMTYNYNDLIEITPRYNYGFDKTKYSTNLGRATDYTNSSLSINLETYWPKWVEFANDFTINNNPDVAAGFTQTSYMWNASLGFKILKEKGILKIKAFDLLDQNTSVNQSTNQDYISNTESLVLKRYFMLSFTYKVKKFKGDAKKGVMIH